MQRHAVQRRCHAVLADAVVQVAPLAVIRPEGAKIAGLGIVRPCEVRRATQRLWHHGVDDFKRLLRGDTGRDLGCLLRDRLLQRLDLGREPGRGLACHDAGELFLAGIREGCEAALPIRTGCGTAPGSLGPGFLHVCGDFERLVRPVKGLARIRDQLVVCQGAMAFGGVLRRGANRDMRLASDHHGTVVLGIGSPIEGLFHSGVIVAINAFDFPT